MDKLKTYLGPIKETTERDGSTSWHCTHSGICFASIESGGDVEKAREVVHTKIHPEWKSHWTHPCYDYYHQGTIHHIDNDGNQYILDDKDNIYARRPSRGGYFVTSSRYHNIKLM